MKSKYQLPIPNVNHDFFSVTLKKVIQPVQFLLHSTADYLQAPLLSHFTIPLRPTRQTNTKPHRRNDDAR